jgi:hypothetical protein
LLSESTFPLSSAFVHHVLLLDLAFKQSVGFHLVLEACESANFVAEEDLRSSSHNGTKIQKPAAVEFFSVFRFAISLLDRDTQCMRQPQICLFQIRIQLFRVAESVLAG